MKNMLQDFKKFALRGNVIDLAVGMVIGAAFTSIVNSLVKDVFNPLIGLLISNVDFSELFIVLKGDGEYTTLQQANAAGAVTLNYGLFINACIQFIIVAFAIFMLIKQFERLRSKEESKPAPVTVPEDVKLLGEIRDLLKSGGKAAPVKKAVAVKPVARKTAVKKPAAKTKKK